MRHILSVSELLTIQANENSTLQSYRNFYLAMFSFVLFFTTINQINNSRILFLLFALPFVGLMLLLKIQENRVTVVEHYCKTGGLSLDEYLKEIRGIRIQLPKKYKKEQNVIFGARWIFSLLRWITAITYLVLMLLSFK
jgi:hypothetical protein